ncbi:hypothetical protein ACET85_20360 [Aeromonas veronii]|uniref:hypothetical protein n=1 Tax=Aeromonas TaxID=642 RepID=UPI0036727FFA
MAFIGMRVNREGDFARWLRMLGRNAMSQDLALKRARKRCKLSGGQSLPWVSKRPKTRYRRPHPDEVAVLPCEISN